MAADIRNLETLIVERSDSGITTITMNRPFRKNAINDVMWDELQSEFVRLADSPDDRVVILTGAEGDFCSGADVSGMGGGSSDGEGGGESTPPQHQLATMRRIGDIALRLARLPQPTIAKVRGVAAGAGLNMALLCDLLVAGEDARFSEIFARRGLTIDFGGSWILPRRVGMHRAKELTLLADIIDSSAAQEMGLVNRVLPDDEVDAFTQEWAERLASGPPIALAMSKRLLNNSFGVTLEEALDDEGLSQTVNFGTKDTFEAVMAFLDKRDPVFRGQ